MILRDEFTGQMILPGRVTRVLTDPLMATPTAALAAWQAISAGTATFENFSGANSLGGVTLTTPAATNGSAAAIKAAAPLNNITPNNFTALGLVLEGLTTDADTGMDIEFGFQGNSSHGGACFMHLNGAARGIVRTKDAVAVATDYTVNHTFFATAGGGRKRRNVAFWIFPKGYASGSGAARAIMLEDDQTVFDVDISASFDGSQVTCPIWDVVNREAVAHAIKWRQAKLILNSN